MTEQERQKREEYKKAGFDFNQFPEESAEKLKEMVKNAEGYVLLTLDNNKEDDSVEVNIKTDDLENVHFIIAMLLTGNASLRERVLKNMKLFQAVYEPTFLQRMAKKILD